MATNGVNASTLRLTGLTSGLDTESIVKSLLEIDQLKVDKQQKLITKLEWQGDAYRSVNLQLKNFREKYMSTLSSDNMYTKAAYNIFNATLATDTSAVKVSAGSSAIAGSYTINSIDQLAAAATVSSGAVKMGDDIGLSTKLSDLHGIEFHEEEIPGEVGEDGELGESTTVRTLSFSINGEEFTFSDSATLSEVISTVNSNTKAGVKMSYSSLKQGFTVTSNTTGASSSVTILNNTGNFFGENSVSGIENGTKTGQNAILTIENVRVEKSTNNFTIDGITYSLKAESKNTAINFSVERDVDAVVNKISGFIDSYNELITSLQSKLNETVYSTFEPLTDTERDQLTEKQAEQWDEKAKSGLLRNDSKLSSLLSTLRGAFYTAVESAGISAYDVGLTTGAYTDGGKITLNKDKLKSAIEKNPEQVTNLFSAVSSASDPNVKNAQSGLMARLTNAMDGYRSYVTSETLDSNGKALSTAQDKLGELEDWLSDNEESYYARFTAMETALTKLNSQTSWISALLGSST